MTAQLTLEGNRVKTCEGCGIARPDWANDAYTNISLDHCTACRELAGEEREDCDGCEESLLEGDLHAEWYFFSPWNDEESETGFKYCQPCVDTGKDDAGESYFWCGGCDRPVANDSGRMTYYRILEGDILCLRCIQETLMEEGVAGIEDGNRLEAVFAGELFGMFFNVGELEAAGWQPDPLYHNYRVDGGETVKKLCARAHGWHVGGRLFILGYESLSIMGDEGYVTLYTKERTE